MSFEGRFHLLLSYDSLRQFRGVNVDLKMFQQ